MGFWWALVGCCSAFGGVLVSLGEPLMNFCRTFDGFGGLVLCISLAFRRLFVDFWRAFWLAFDMLFGRFWLALVNLC